MNSTPPTKAPIVPINKLAYNNSIFCERQFMKKTGGVLIWIWNNKARRSHFVIFCYAVDRKQKSCHFTNMQTVTLELNTSRAQILLDHIRREITAKHRDRENLNREISALEVEAKELESQLGGVEKVKSPAPYGSNKIRIRDYLSSIPNNQGAPVSHIVRATRIINTSVRYALLNNPEDFFQDGNYWKLNKNSMKLL